MGIEYIICFSLTVLNNAQLESHQICVFEVETFFLGLWFVLKVNFIIQYNQLFLPKKKKGLTM